MQVTLKYTAYSLLLGWCTLMIRTYIVHCSAKSPAPSVCAFRSSGDELRITGGCDVNPAWLAKQRGKSPLAKYVGVPMHDQMSIRKPATDAQLELVLSS